MCLCDLSRPYAAACFLLPRGTYQVVFKNYLLSILHSRYKRVKRCVCVILAGPMLQHASCFPERRIQYPHDRVKTRALNGNEQNTCLFSPIVVPYDSCRD